MDAKQYLTKIGLENAIDEEFFNNDDKSWYTVQELMESYYKSKQSEQLKPFHCPNCKQPWDTRLTNSCQCGASIKRF